MDKIGKFSVVETLGSGAHSSILHVRRDEDGKDYALKVVPIDGKDDLKYLEQAKHEYRVGQLLSHPNLVKILCLEVEKGLFSGPKRARPGGGGPPAFGVSCPHDRSAVPTRGGVP